MKRLLLLLRRAAPGRGRGRACRHEDVLDREHQRADRRPFERSLTVPERGPVSFVHVSFRISTPDTSALAISLVSPKGTEVPLVMKRGAAPTSARRAGCGGVLTVLDSDRRTNPIAAGKAPFTDNPYRPEGNLASLYGEDAKGKWTLRVTNAGRPATSSA